MSEVIESTTETVQREIRLTVDSDPRTGRRRAHYDNRVIASEDDDDIVRCFLFCKAIREARIRNATVAHIGMGFANLAWMLGPSFTHTFYELKPLGRAYRPYFVRDEDVIRGDWRTTLTGTYDVIVYDIGGDADIPRLRSHLNQGGLLLGVD